jgi:CRISPR-associated protein Cas5h
MMEEIITFKLCGKMAHFRKFYSNASALSHTIPPRTTIMGILAATIGLPRDSYYHNSKEYPELDKLLVGIRIASPLRKINQKLNYLKTGDTPNLDDLMGFDNRSQVSSEFIVPTNIISGIVSYQVFIGTYQKEDYLFQELKQKFYRQYSEFGISLGGANMLGYIEVDGLFELNFRPLKNSKSEFVIMNSAIPDSKVEKINYNTEITLEQDILPHHFELLENIKGFTQNRVAKTHTLLYSLSEHGGVELALSDTDNIFYLPQLNFNISLY